MALPVIAAVYTLWHLCVGWLADFPLYGDEAQYWVWGKNLDFGYYSKPPLIGWILGLFTALFGDTPFAVRIPVLFAHLITGYGLYRFACDHKHSSSVAAFIFLAYLSMPGVSFSSHIISTDPIVLSCWAWAMVWGYRFICAPNLKSASWLGIILGVGLLAKYAMIWFVVMFPVVLWLLHMQIHVHSVGRYIPWIVILMFLIISPNIYWNYTQAWPTFAHTANNIGGWKGLNISNALIFLITQVGILGPIVAVGGVVHARRVLWREDVRFSLGFSLPVLGVIVVQALVNRSHGNWAAIAHVGMVYVCVCGLLESHQWLRRGVIVNLVMAVLMGGVSIAARYHFLPHGINPYQRFYRGTRILDALEAQKITLHDKVLVCDGRQLVAQLMYQLRNSTAIVVRYNPDNEPLDYFGMNTDMHVEPHKNRIFIGPTCLVEKQRDDMGVLIRDFSLVLGKPFKPLCLQEYRP